MKNRVILRSVLSMLCVVLIFALACGCAAAEEPAPTPLPDDVYDSLYPQAPAEYLTELPNGNLRYDDGKIAFEAPAGTRIVVPQIRVNNNWGVSIMVRHNEELHEMLREHNPGWDPMSVLVEPLKIMGIATGSYSLANRIYENVYDAESLAKAQYEDDIRYNGKKAGQTAGYGTWSFGGKTAYSNWTEWGDGGIYETRRENYYVPVTEERYVAAMVLNDFHNNEYRMIIDTILSTLELNFTAADFEDNGETAGQVQSPTGTTPAPVVTAVPEATPVPEITEIPYDAEEGDDYFLMGPVTWWNGEIPSEEVHQNLLQELYYHVGVWEDVDTGELLTIQNNSMTGLDYTLTVTAPTFGSFEFEYVTVDPGGRYVIFYSEDGMNEAHVYLPFNNAPYVQFFSKDNYAQMDLNLGVRSYRWHGTLPGAADRDPLDAWTGDWYDYDNGAALDIMHTQGDDMLHVFLHVDDTFDMDFHFSANDYEIVEYDVAEGLHLYMNLDAYSGGRLEFRLEADPDNPNSPDPQSFSVGANVDVLMTTFNFYTECPPDLTWYGWSPDFGPEQENMPVPEEEPGSLDFGPPDWAEEPVEEIPAPETAAPVITEAPNSPTVTKGPADPATPQPVSRKLIETGTKLDPIEAFVIKSELAGLEWVITSANGTMDGTLRFSVVSGMFEGTYNYRDGYGNRQTVSFTGIIDDVYQVNDKLFRLIVGNTTTKNTPGWTVGDDGREIVYLNTIFPKGCELIYTRPTVEEDRISEWVTDMFRKTHKKWEKVTDCHTICNAITGVGYYAEGKAVWNGNLFKDKASVYNKGLALIAANLSRAAEDTTGDNIKAAFEEYGFTNVRVRNYDAKLPDMGPLDDFIKFIDAYDAFAIGKSIVSVKSENDTTILVVVARGTQMRFRELKGDVLKGGTQPLLGRNIYNNIYEYGDLIWQGIKNYLVEFPITTHKVKVLVTGHSLGGAAANLVGARITSELKNQNWLKSRGATKEDIYVYTFGAIKVFDQEENESKGYENIHNLYNDHDSFGPNGSKSLLNVSHPKTKFGHTDTFDIDEYDEWWNLKDIGRQTLNHNMEVYIKAIQCNMIDCGTSGSIKSQSLEDGDQTTASITVEPSASGEEMAALSTLADHTLQASSGASAWEGTLTLAADGSFFGDYYDADAEEEYRVSFSGCFGEITRVSDTSFILTVASAATEVAPGTEETDESGYRIVYMDTLLPEGSQWLLTLPGTPEDSIPETVRDEIFGTFWEETDYSAYVTLTQLDNGWGFFMKADGAAADIGIPEIVPELPAEETPSPAVELLPIGGKLGFLQIPVAYIASTAYIVSQQDASRYAPERMLDGDETTSWQFTTKDVPLGSAYIYITFPAPVNLDELWLKNGFWKNDQYVRNCRIKDMAVEFMYEDSDNYEDRFTVTLPDDKKRKDWTVVDLGQKAGVMEVRIQILDVYQGSKFKNDVAVSELMFVQKEN